MDWIRLKRIPVPSNLSVESFAFAIAANIGKRGTNPKPRPFINPAISSVMRNIGDKLIGEGATNEIVTAVNEQLQSIKVKA